MARSGINEGKSTMRGPLSSASLIILDLDADALSPAYLPATHLLPPQLTARLWKACAMYAPLWAWARTGAPVTPPLPHFPVASPAAEIAAVHDLWRDFNHRASIRQTLRGESSFRFDSIFAPLPQEPNERPKLTRSPASLRTIDYLHSDDEGSALSGSGTSNTVPEDFFAEKSADICDVASIPLCPPWALWRAGITAVQSADSFDAVRGPEPPVHFARVRLAFLSVFVSLVKGFRLYTTVEGDEEVEEPPRTVVDDVVDDVSGAAEAIASLPSAAAIIDSPEPVAVLSPLSRSRVASFAASEMNEPQIQAVIHVRSRALTINTPRGLPIIGVQARSEVDITSEPGTESQVGSPISPTDLIDDLSASTRLPRPLATPRNLGLEQIAQPFLHALGPSLPRLPMAAAKAASNAASIDSSAFSVVSLKATLSPMSASEFASDSSVAAPMSLESNSQEPTIRRRVINVVLNSAKVAAVSADLSAISVSEDGVHEMEQPSAVVTIVADEDVGIRASQRVIWNTALFVNSERGTSAVNRRGTLIENVDSGGSAEAFLSHLSSCLHWSAFIDSRHCRQWECVAAHLKSVASWRRAVAAGRKRARALAAGGRPVFLVAPAPPAPPVLSEPDIFDRLCFERILHRDFRLRVGRTTPMVGSLWKANRGTLCKNWTRRHFVLGLNGVFGYYGKPSEIIAAERAVALARVRIPLTAATMASAAAARGPQMIPSGPMGAPVDDGTAAAHSEARAALARAKATLMSLLSSEYRDRFELVPGQTRLRIPCSTSAEAATGVSLLPERESEFVNDGSMFPTRYPFQLVTLSPREDVLTLCADSAESRREWILRIRAFLGPQSSVTPSWLLAHRTAAPSGLASSNLSLFLRLLYLGDVEALAAVASPDDAEAFDDSSSASAPETTSPRDDASVDSGPVTGHKVCVSFVPFSSAIATLDKSMADVEGDTEERSLENTSSSVHDEYRTAILLQGVRQRNQ
jgi:hypothetical protein